MGNADLGGREPAILGLCLELRAGEEIEITHYKVS